jgi:hypothetical protein
VGHIEWEKRNVYRVLEEQPKGTEPAGRPRYRCRDNIRIGKGKKVKLFLCLIS